MLNRFNKTSQILSSILKEIEIAEQRQMVSPSDPAKWIASQLSGTEVVLFCGAGISISQPAGAPSFLELRNSAVLCAMDILAERGLVPLEQVGIVEKATEMLEMRCDVSFPPEFVFGRLSNTLGFDTVHDILRTCLSRGKPNENHLAIPHLVTSDLDWSLVGVITPNFDNYIEHAFEGIVPLSRRIRDDLVGNPKGFPLLKPHGSLDIPDSICITIDRVARPLKGAARQAFQELVTGRVILVIGYSGWDYDLLPLLAAATRDWGSRILWILYDETSWNERVALVKIANPEMCQIINCRQMDVIPKLGGKPMQVYGCDPIRLRSEFRLCLKNKADENLIAAVISLLTPMGVPDSTGIVEGLCKKMMTMARKGEIRDNRQALNALSYVALFYENDETNRREAATLALEQAKRLGDVSAERSFQHKVDGEPKPITADDHLTAIEHNLIELESDNNPKEPDPINAKLSMKISLLTEKARLLMDCGRIPECKELVEEILLKTDFPESCIAPNCWIVDDGHLSAPLIELLGTCEIRKGKFEYADDYFTAAIEVFWREKSLWKMADTLIRLAREIGSIDKSTSRLLMDTALSIARFEHDRLSELIAFEWILELGLGGNKELNSAMNILKDIVDSLDSLEYKSHKEILDRLERSIRTFNNQ